MEAAVTTRNCWLGGFLAPGLLRRWKTLSLGVQLAPHHQVKNHSIILPWCQCNHCIGKQKTPEELKNLLGINILIKKNWLEISIWGNVRLHKDFAFSSCTAKKKLEDKGKVQETHPQKESVGTDMWSPGFEIQFSSCVILCSLLC